MSKKRFIIVASLLAVAMMAVAVAQKTTDAMHHHGDMMGLGDPSGFLADYLDLTDQQKQQVQSIFAAEKPKAQPLMDDLHAAHKQIQTAIDNGSLDQAAALSIIDAHKTQFAQLLAEHAQIHAQIMKVLTPAQQAKLKRFHERHEGHMGHGGMGMGEPPAQPQDQSSH